MASKIVANNHDKRQIISIVDAASWYCAIFLVALVLLSFSREDFLMDFPLGKHHNHQLLGRACDEIYIVGEGETLHTISDKCCDPFIVEHNPHIHDPDDVYPGLVIKITPQHQRSM